MEIQITYSYFSNKKIVLLKNKAIWYLCNNCFYSKPSFYELLCKGSILHDLTIQQFLFFDFQICRRVKLSNIMRLVGADSGWLNLVSLPASDCFAIKYLIIFHATIILTIARLKSVKANGGVFLLYSWEFNINNLRVMKSNTFDILLKVFIGHKNECTKFLHTLFNRWASWCSWIICYY